MDSMRLNRRLWPTRRRRLHERNGPNDNSSWNRTNEEMSGLKTERILLSLDDDFQFRVLPLQFNAFIYDAFQNETVPNTVLRPVRPKSSQEGWQHFQQEL